MIYIQWISNNVFVYLSYFRSLESHPTHLSRRHHPGVLFSLDLSSLAAHPGPWTGTNIHEERSNASIHQTAEGTPLSPPWWHPVSLPYSNHTGQHGRAQSPPVDTEPSVPTFCVVCLSPASADQQRCRRLLKKWCEPVTVLCYMYIYYVNIMYYTWIWCKYDVYIMLNTK